MWYPSKLFEENFNKLTWDNKYNLAYQLSCAVSYLHNEKLYTVTCIPVMYWFTTNW
ncbi:hypothetical protein C1645_841741 [Glomus cerebriforme]|uniref:Protein kinase domain-containing protein n=1 Tax=Glomus cerebriforme TaxID=658196 RepID=A0A397S8H0_9GLOM|nr:hypothetical protein C1645_841741 [Glomus cerebriforme]